MSAFLSTLYAIGPVVVGLVFPFAAIRVMCRPIRATRREVSPGVYERTDA